MKTLLSAVTTLIILAHIPCQSLAQTLPYVIVDTNQNLAYDDVGNITHNILPGQRFYGQDAHYSINPANYQVNNDATVSDLNTGLMWVQSIDGQVTFEQAVSGAATCNVGGYDDWRLPTIKELYSLMDFRGWTGMSANDSAPYLDDSVFEFEYGDLYNERFIDAQYWSATQYVGQVFQGVDAIFGVNFADGRIKGYPRDIGMDGGPMDHFVRYVRGNTSYGQNNFVDKGDGTIVDLATGLMWLKTDSTQPMSWEDALAYAENLDTAGYDDWRLPSAKELQSIVDYTRAPDAADPTKQSAAIDPIFDITETESFFWSSTTHVEGPLGDHAAYIAFGRATGYMEQPPGSGNYVYQNVHGAGAQRSDPKTGDPDDYPHGHGPQGDDIRILNYARAVRSIDILPGDTNFDGKVDLIDLTTLGENYNLTGRSWIDGDFNGDGIVDLTDLTTLGENYNSTTNSPIPEPATISILLTALTILRHR